MAERFRRALGGFDPTQVRAAIEERDVRLARLEREAQQLAARVLETEKRVRREMGERVPEDPGKAIAGLRERLEEIHGQARRQATRIRMSALQDAVQISEKVSELSRMRDDLGAKVTDLAGSAGIKVGSGEDRPAVGTEPAATAADGVYAGAVEVEVGPLRDFAQLTSFEDAVSTMAPDSEVKVRNFSGGRAVFSMNFAQPIELVRELEQSSPFGFKVRDADAESVVLDLDDEPHAA